MKLSLKDWYTANELVFYKNRCYVPDDLILRRNVVQKYHDTVSVGHPGCLATQILVQRDYWWPGMATFQYFTLPHTFRADPTSATRFRPFRSNSDHSDQILTKFQAGNHYFRVG